MSTTYLDQFVRAIEAGDRAVVVGPDDSGHRALLGYQGEHYDPPLVLDFSDEQFEAAVYATARSGGSSLWPDVPEPEAGIRLMLVHLEESLMSTKPVSRRIYIAEGQLQAE
ncbi:hypothetical protein [Pseudonocardia sp. MH-G8]|uniref:hypothetical protein n=1 Tax=Pseudonocardia sp. MH-G8 TaxID=1854588 RepID=UPI000BA1261C|nr:hypothetical protein [Pseudonocardia sp. MH-G8]OZM82566.1 hypothetical protein CFP66_07505 [Pseudonocardia sp. MH-G8]